MNHCEDCDGQGGWEVEDGWRDCPSCDGKGEPRRAVIGPSDIEIAAWQAQMRRLFGDDVIAEWEEGK